MDKLTRNFLFWNGLADGERHAVPVNPDGSPECDFWTIREKIGPPAGTRRFEEVSVSLRLQDVRTQDYRPLLIVIDGCRDYIFYAIE